jgi:hypothetical protein
MRSELFGALPLFYFFYLQQRKEILILRSALTESRKAETTEKTGMTGKPE